jgi:diguanylate cyclase (GGDEF)-like protein
VSKRSAAARHSRRTVVGVAVLLVSFLGLLGGQLRDTQRQARVDTEARFVARGDAAAAFVTGVAQEQMRRERRHARAVLGGDPVDVAAFNDMVVAFDLDAALLLGGDGRALAVHPPNPAMIGTDLAAQHDYLRLATNGEPAVSGLMASSVERRPVVAFATPFASASGGRVFSGEFDIARTPIQGYLDNAVPLRGYETFVVDQDSNVLAAHRVRGAGASGGTTLRDADSALATMLAGDEGRTYRDARGEQRFVDAQPIKGTPWRIISTVPTSELYRALEKTATTPWIVFAAFTVTGVLALVLLVRLGRRTDELDRLASVDALTGLSNRRRLDAIEPTGDNGVVLVDNDQFKTINDDVGHRGGDDVLQIVAERIRRSVRSTDLPVRWGGEEFLVYLAGADRTGAATTAERIRAAVAEVITMPNEAASRAVTCSVGWTVGRATEFDQLVAHADEALYVAKASGRNCVVEWSPPSAGKSRGRKARQTAQV